MDASNSRRDRLNTWIPLLLAAAVALGLFAGWKLQQSNRQSSLINKIDSEVVITQGRIEEILRYIDLKYVDKTNRDSLEAKVVNTILAELDPFSVYLPASKVEELKSFTQAQYEGLGLEWVIHRDTPVIVRVAAGSPAADAEILPGDHILALNDTACTGPQVKQEWLMQRLRGKVGDEVRLLIQKDSTAKEESVALSFAEVKIPVIDAAMMLDDSTGYIRVNRFSSHTYRSFMEAVERLVERDHMRNLVLDLRQNPGGLLQEAANMLSQFFAEKGKLLVYTEGRFYRRNEYRSTGRPFFPIQQIAVLIDEGTASASEVVAGALQDYDRGIIIGRNSYGKGLVQEQYPLSNGSAIRLTVARYFTPAGRLIQRDFKHKEDYDQYFKQRLLNGDLFRPDSTQLARAKKYYTSGGREVYDLDGIRPDIFVALDSAYTHPAFQRSLATMPGFVLDYYLDHRARFRMSRDSFFADSLIQAETVAAFYSSSRTAKNAAQISPRHQSLLRRELLANMAGQVYGKDAYFAYFMRQDPMVLAALSAFRQQQR